MPYSIDFFTGILKTRSDIMLTPNFRLSDMIKTNQPADNWPSHASELESLQYVATWVLEKVLANFGKPITVNSAYRSPATNSLVGGSTSSQHMKAQAVDFEIPGVANADLAFWIRDNLVFDQLILEFYQNGKPSSGWVHCSVKPKNNRTDLRTARKNQQTGKTQYLPGLIL